MFSLFVSFSVAANAGNVGQNAATDGNAGQMKIKYCNCMLGTCVEYKGKISSRGSTVTSMTAHSQTHVFVKKIKRRSRLFNRKWNLIILQQIKKLADIFNGICKSSNSIKFCSSV